MRPAYVVFQLYKKPRFTIKIFTNGFLQKKAFNNSKLPALDW